MSYPNAEKCPKCNADIALASNIAGRWIGSIQFGATHHSRASWRSIGMVGPHLVGA